jgi:capsular exopolysaccharide synthesis family protein
LSISQTDKTSSVIQLSLKTTVPERGEDFLNTLLQKYQQAGMEDKNEMAANTIKFVNTRLDSLTQELNGVESRLQHFMSTNGMANIEEQSKLFLDQASQLDQELTKQQLQLKILQQIHQYVSQPEKSYDLVPSTLGIQDPTLLSLIQQYNALQLQRSQQVRAGASPNNPIVKTMDHQINELRNNIRENVSNLEKSVQLAINKLEEQNQAFENKIRNVPKLQRDYISIKRQQDIKQTLYIYLLQKREEASITKAAAVSNSKVIDPAKTIPQPVAPKKRLIYLAALLLGLGLPGGLLYLKETLSRKITSRQDVEALTDVPIYAEVGHSQKEGPLVVMSGVRSPVAEQFRNLRTNLNFVLGATGKKKIILITSSMSGEGKSFVSLNLAMTYALLGKRTVLVDMDLRRPKLGRYLNMENHLGVSSYLAGEKMLEALPAELTFGQHNLHFINSGPVPPNPAELLLQPAMDEMITWLQEKYDYILLDTPPVGLVTDAQVLEKYADASLYIIRHNYTMKEQLRGLKNLQQDKKLPGLGIVLNDIKAGDSYRYGYGGYGYGYGYYSENGHANSSVYQKVKASIKGS